MPCELKHASAGIWSRPTNGTRCQKIARAEIKSARNSERLSEIDQAMGDVEKMTKVLGKSRAKGAKAAKRATARLIKKLGTTTTASLKLAKAPNVKQQIDATIDDILESQNPFGILDDANKIKTSARFLRRGIHLGDERFSEEARELLLHNAHDTRAGYVSSVGRQIAMREAFP